VGEERAGMRVMFTMMNHARINVGLQGVAIAERAYQEALAYARERVQVQRIIEFPDVRRMLMTLKATTEAIRALTYRTAAEADRAHGEMDADARRAAQGLADLLTPVTKAYATDMGVQMSSLALQVFGGMGYIEETGAAQHLRDARIAPIYEGTNGIQAIDLVGRKLPQGHWTALFEEIRVFIQSLPDSGDLGVIAAHLEEGLDALDKATHWMSRRQESDPADAAAGATPYLRIFGTVMGAYLLARQAATAQAMPEGYDPKFLEAKTATARFFVEQILPQSTALVWTATRGSAALFELGEDSFSASH